MTGRTAVLSAVGVILVLAVWRAQGTAWETWAEGLATAVLVVVGIKMVLENIRAGQYSLTKRR